MRDLEEEQRQIRDALASFLDDMQEHIDKLPDKEELKELRETAQKFVKDVRGSGASEAMAAAESALAEFDRTRGHKKAKEAADILEKFIKECNGMRQLRLQGAEVPAELCARGLGNTIAQLLAGDGHGRRHGRRQRNGRLRPDRPLRRTAAGVGKSRAKRPAAAKATPAERAARRSANPDEARPGELFAPGAAAGASEGAVPVRYRRQVGQYFQRVAEETGESGR